MTHSREPKSDPDGDPPHDPTSGTPGTSGTPPKRTLVEQRFLVQMERLQGRPLSVYEENLSIEQCLALNGTLD